MKISLIKITFTIISFLGVLFISLWFLIDVGDESEVNNIAIGIFSAILSIRQPK